MDINATNNLPLSYYQNLQKAQDSQKPTTQQPVQQVAQSVDADGDHDGDTGAGESGGKALNLLI